LLRNQSLAETARQELIPLVHFQSQGQANPLSKRSNVTVTGALTHHALTR